MKKYLALREDLTLDDGTWGKTAQTESLYLCSEADAVIASNAYEPGKTSATIEVWRKECAARDETIAKLKELVRFCCTEFSDGTMPEEYIWNESETKKRLDSDKADPENDLMPHSDPPATAHGSANISSEAINRDLTEDRKMMGLPPATADLTNLSEQAPSSPLIEPNTIGPWAG